MFRNFLKSYTDAAKVYLTYNEVALRNANFTPYVLNEMGSKALIHGQYARALIQYSAMLRLTPKPEEAYVFEHSGNQLAEFNFLTCATQHWMNAFLYDHRPYQMCTHLGNFLIKEGLFQKAQDVFQYQMTQQPNDAISLNNLGIVNLMDATQQGTPLNFTSLQEQSIRFFQRALDSKPDDLILQQNYQTAQVLRPGLRYGKPFSLFELKPDRPIAITLPIIRELEAKEKSNTNGNTIEDLKKRCCVIEL